MPLGTAGAIRLARSRFALQIVLVMNGDSYCSADFRRFYAWHCRKGFEGSLLLTHVTETSRYGRVQIDDDVQVVSFEEKASNFGAGWINAGVYLLSPGLLSEIPADGAVSLERELLPVWIRRPFGGYRSESQFLDIGLPESYAETERFFAPWPPRKTA